jgi:hypothetical protein
VTTLLILCQFFIPFGLLLARDRKRDITRLVRVAVFLLAVRVLDLFYLVQPEFSPNQFQVHWLDLFVCLAMGGAWFALFSQRMEREVAQP